MIRRAPPLLAALALACSGTPKGPAETRIPAGTATLVVAPDGRSMAWKRAETTLLTLPADAFRLGIVSRVDEAQSYDPYWLETDDVLKPKPPDDLEWRDPKSMSATAAGITLTYDGGVVTIGLDEEAGGRLGLRLRPHFANEAVAYVRLRLRADKQEAFYGLGEWGDTLNHRGHLRPMQMEADLSYESANTENHAPIPLLIGTRGWGLFVESRQPGLFDVARREDDLVEVTYALAREKSGEFVVHLISEPAPLDVTRHYHELTGVPRLPAPWALGPWIWRNENRDQAQVLDDVKHIRDLDLATSAIWIDRPYATAVNTFDFDPQKFTDADTMIAAIHAAGLRLALWHTPYLEDATGDLHRTAIQQGYYPPATGILLNPGWGKPIDFDNPDAYTWWKGLVRRYTDRGIEGFKLDFAEDVVVGLAGARGGWKFFGGSDESTMHHDYQILYHQTYSETLPETGGFLLCRTARWGDQKNGTVLWPGDLDANFAKKGDARPDGKKYVGGLPASVILGLGLGPSGFPFYGADTGGYQHGPPKKEVYVRWFEQTALSTVMQVGDSSSQPVWEFNAENGRDEETLDLYRAFVRLHLRLFPYEWTYAQRLPSDGRPIARPLGLAYPELGEHPDDEYLFGDALLVAPVVAEGATTKSVLFPAGTWIDWFDGTVHEGGRETVAAPLQKLPLYLRTGAIVPLLRPTIDTLAPATDEGVESYANDAGLLYVRIVPDAKASSFTLYDGTRITQEKTGNGVQIEVKRGTTFTKGYVLELLRTKATGATLAGTALPTVTAEAFESAPKAMRTDDALGGTTWLKLPAEGGTVTTN